MNKSTAKLKTLFKLKKIIIIIKHISVSLFIYLVTHMVFNKSKICHKIKLNCNCYLQSIPIERFMTLFLYSLN